MLDIVFITACIALGMLCGALWRRGTLFLRLADKLSLYAVYGLLFVLGARLGADAALLRQLPLLGSQALCIALLCTAGSVIFLVAAQRLLLPAPPGPRKNTTGAPPGAAAPVQSPPGTGVSAHQTPPGTAAPPASALTGSLRILVCFGGGAILARFSLTPSWLADSALATYTLFLLVFAVGIGLGADLRAFRVLRDLHVKILAVPLLIVAGSVLGSLLAAVLLPGLSVKESLCAGMGLGYYSLSSILIENAGQSALASVALLANILREITTILAAPLLVRLCGPLSTVGAAGATAMDTTLPIIARFSGEYAAVIAVFSGMSLTLLVPFLVSAALRL